MSAASPADELRVVLREQAGLDLAALVPTSDGKRHYPTAATTRHHLHLAHLVVTDIR